MNVHENGKESTRIQIGDNVAWERASAIGTVVDRFSEVGVNTRFVVLIEGTPHEYEVLKEEDLKVI